MRATKNSGLQPALDWIEEHPDGGFFDDDKVPADDKPITTTDDDKGKGKETGEPEASTVIPDDFKKAFKCSQCEKTFASIEMAELHASKTGHDDFSETLAKKLSEEEKAERLQELKQKLAEKRAAEAELEKERELENERLRRKAGKDTKEMKREREMKQYDKIRQEQLKDQAEEKRAKERILAMIEEDRRERMSKLSKTPETVTKQQQQQQSEPLHAPTPTDSARVQIRLSDGRALKYTIKSQSTLHDLVELVAKDHPDLEGRTFIMMPDNRVLTAVDHKVTLEKLGMSPSATLLLK